MRVLIISPNFLEPTAWMVSAYKTAKLLNKFGHNVTVITSKTKGSKTFEEIDRIKVSRFPCFFISDPFNYTIIPFFSFYLLGRLFKEKPEIIIVSKYMFYTSFSVFLLRLFGKKVILQTDTFPGINWSSRDKFLNLLMWLYSNSVGRLILRLSNKVVILHEGLINASKRLGLNYEVIHNGVDFDKYQLGSVPSDLLKFKGNNLLLSYVGRLDQIKGFDLLLDSLSDLDSSNLKILFVCGDKNNSQRAVLQKKYPAVKFIGFRDDIPEIMNLTDIYVIPSFSEGLPNTLMEAMASGCACVASDVGGIKFLIQHNETGLLFRKGDKKGLIDNINQLVTDNNLRANLGNNAKEKIRVDFNLNNLIKNWNNLFKEIR